MNCICGNPIRGRGAVGLLIVRLVFGLGIMLHGWYKLQSPGGPMHWMPPEAPVPAFFQGLAVLAEFGGGIAIVLGLLTPLASLGLTCNMLVALFMVHIGAPQPVRRQHAATTFVRTRVGLPRRLAASAHRRSRQPFAGRLDLRTVRLPPRCRESMRPRGGGRCGTGGIQARRSIVYDGAATPTFLSFPPRGPP